MPPNAGQSSFTGPAFGCLEVMRAKLKPGALRNTPGASALPSSFFAHFGTRNAVALVEPRPARRVARFFAFFALCFSAAVAQTSAVRVVSQSVGTDELLLALAEPAQVAALSDLSRRPEYSAVATEACRYPQLVAGDAESILKYSPTVVLAADYSRAELIEQVRRAGVRVVLFDRYNTLDDAFANLLVVGRELGPTATARAERIIAETRARLVRLEQRLRGVTPVRVIAPSIYGVIAGADTTFDDVCAHAGAVNLAASLGHLRGHRAPPNEQMLSWPIDRVVVAGTSLEAALRPYRDLSPYQFMSAIREGRAALLDPWMLSCVTHHRIDGYERLARELHPEIFRSPNTPPHE
jgi:iron complex transport system substrate-binding protein